MPMPAGAEEKYFISPLPRRIGMMPGTLCIGKEVVDGDPIA
jgi:hypothetical protein